jgi:hypothetical protein
MKLTRVDDNSSLSLVAFTAASKSWPKISELHKPRCGDK